MGKTSFKTIQGDIFEGNHEVIAFGLNRHANDAGFCGVIQEKFNLSADIFDGIAGSLEVGEVFLLRLSGIPITLAGMIIHDKPGATNPKDVATCIRNLKALVQDDRKVGIVAIGCGFFGRMKGGFLTLIKILEQAEFRGTVYEPQQG